MKQTVLSWLNSELDTVPPPTQLAPILAEVVIVSWNASAASPFKNWLFVPPSLTKHLDLTALLALILSLTVKVSQLVHVPIDKWPSSWKIISSPFLSMKWAIGCDPSCWTKSAGPVPALTTDKAEVVVIDVSIQVNAPKTDKLPVIVVSSVNVFLPPISCAPVVLTTVELTHISGVVEGLDIEIPAPSESVVTVPWQPPLPALKAANCVWTSNVTLLTWLSSVVVDVRPLRQLNSVLLTTPVPIKLASSLLDESTVSCLAVIWACIPLVTPSR